MRPTTDNCLLVRARRHDGFALLLVITLLAFTVLVLLGLAAFARVETSIAGNTQRQAQARENARLALDIALGQLQRYAGPDTRVTATAQHVGGIDGTRHYTGVWSSNPTGVGTPATPLTWLVSGNERRVPDGREGAASGSTVPAPLAVSPDAPGAETVILVGRHTTGSAILNADYVIAPLSDLTASGIPGTVPTASTRIGRYAFWVGDQGVKAPVALADVSQEIRFTPYDSADLRTRIRQQQSLGAGAFDPASGAPIFDPRDSVNAQLVANHKVTTAGQISFLRTSHNVPLGLARLRQNLSAWAPNNFAVLADSKSGGLRQDLSLKPDLLGSAFAAWANYRDYLEPFAADARSGDAGASSAPAIVPAYGSDPLRRRYLMQPHAVDGGGSHQVAPILSYFLLTFNVRTERGSQAVRPLEVRARWMISLWNPYTAALLPENLRVEVTGLPTSVRIVNDSPVSPAVVATFSLADAFGAPLRVRLPWIATNAPPGAPVEDRHSWLPGRVYTWRSAEDTTKGPFPPPAGYASAFYSQTLNDGGSGVLRPIAPGVTADGDLPCHLDVSHDQPLVVTVYAVRGDGEVRLGQFTSPAFLDRFITATQTLSRGDYQFSYVFRLAESLDTPATPGTWLSGAARDFRRPSPPPEIFVVGENGNDPAQYGGSYAKIRNPDRLLDRATNSRSYNEDVPVFELPRAPLLSLGALQHFCLVGSRPFMIGNPWGVSASLSQVPAGALFDRFFFSGLAAGVAPTTNAAGELLAPNSLLKPLRTAEGRRVTLADIRATVATPGPDPSVATPGMAPACSSKFFLQGGAFNLNSVNVAAWAAVLRGVRFPAPASFRYLDASEATGTAADSSIASVHSEDGHFFRYSQSAQETYKAEPGKANNDPRAVSPANTHLFRRGMRTLHGAQVKVLAEEIARLVGLKHAATQAGGPFRSLEEFLSPSPMFAAPGADGTAGGPRSLLEAAIADAGINAEVAEFSSQWLTQADIMTALAPVLFSRSDTFVIRTYGEALNPAKLPIGSRPGDPVPPDAIEGRAWAEAIVQRVPEYFDRAADAPEVSPADLTSELNRVHGRRFHLISFRWLTRTDI